MKTKASCYVCLLSLLFVVPLSPFPSRAPGQTGEASDNHAVQVEMRNVLYHYTGSAAVHIVRLQGHLLPARPGAIVVFDDKNSFAIGLASAEISISCTSLAQVLNGNVFSSADGPLKDLSITSRNNELIIKGKLHQKGDVPFESTGTLSADEDGQIRLHVEHVKAAHLPLKGLMDLLGIDLTRLINTKQVHGVVAEKDDLIIDPEQILPPPHVQGKVTAVRVQGNDIVQVFGNSQGSNFAARQRGNYMAFRHGDMRFGKLTMHDADLIMIDMDSRNPFDFFLDHYQDQLVAGYTKSTPEYGLRVYTRDYNQLRNRPAARQPGRQ
jgi:hypothetical protein